MIFREACDNIICSNYQCQSDREFYSYEVYGKPSEVSEAGNPYMFTGRRIDVISDGCYLQYNRNRHYSYNLQRWISPDPLGILPNPQLSNYFKPVDQYKDGMNYYEYVKSNPVNGLDPWGLFSFEDSYDFPKYNFNYCNKCGPDVTSYMNSFKSLVTTSFNSKSDEDKKELCKFNLVSGVWNPIKGWDMTKLINLEAPQYYNCASGECKYTVQISGNCCNRYAVNYYLWGLIHSLCNHDERIMNFGLLWTIFSGDSKEKSKWAQAGFIGQSPSSVFCNGYESCSKCSYSIKRLPKPGDFDWSPHF